MYNQGLNSDFCNFIAEKIQYNLFISIEDILTSNIFNVTTHENFYEVKPLFNYNNVTSNNPKDHTRNNKVLILQKKNNTMLSFTSTQPITEYEELTTETIIGNIKYTLHNTYDKNTGDPAPYKKTSNGNITDKNGYYLDSEVII